MASITPTSSSAGYLAFHAKAQSSIPDSETAEQQKEMEAVQPPSINSGVSAPVVLPPPPNRTSPPRNPIPPAPMTYHRMRSIVESQPIAPQVLENHIKAGNTFCQKVQLLFQTCLHELDTKCDFEERRGAFGYQEVYYKCMQMMERFDGVSRLPCVRTPIKAAAKQTVHRGARAPTREMQQFLKRNIEALNRELEHLCLTQNDQIGSFRVILVDYAHLKETVVNRDAMDLGKLNHILMGLRQLQKILEKTAPVIEERILDLQPLLKLEREVESGQITSTTLMDLDGKWFTPNARNNAERVDATHCAVNFYKAYLEQILDPNFYYCTKFLGAIGRCREDVLNFKRSEGPSPKLLPIGFRSAQLFEEKRPNA